MEDIAYNRIIFGNGDLANELMSFANFSEESTRCISKENFDSLEFSTIPKETEIYIAYSDPKLKKKAEEKLTSNKLEPSSFIHESCLIGRNVKIGKGVILFPNTIISNNTTIEDYVFVNCSCNVGHHCELGKYSSLMSNSCISGHCSIGESNYLGTSAVLIPGIKTPKEIKIGVCSVLMKSPKLPGGSYHGNPAKKIL